MVRIWNILNEYSLLLVFGAIAALIWANTSPDSYHHFIHATIFTNDYVGHYHDGHKEISLHFLTNEILMALFFAIAGKEVWEAVGLKSGSLRGKKALTPVIATVGGMVGPAGAYLLTAIVMGKMAILSNGWAIPTATDIAFSYLIGRLLFGSGHPAVRFLLMLAIVDDAAGLVILAIFYPTKEVAPEYLLLSLAAAAFAYMVFNRLPRMLDGDNAEKPYSAAFARNFSYWPFLLMGAVSWYGFYLAGLHPALGLLPIIPTIPHADTDFGIFSQDEHHKDDLLNRFEHSMLAPVDVILLLFGLCNAGVEFSAMGDATWAVLIGLLIGKPIGIWLMGMFAASTLKLGLPEGMNSKDLFLLGCIAAIGFTVSLFVATVAFPAGNVQDAAKMGALFSFFAAGISYVVAKMLRIQKSD
ncbi:MAG: Na+/H+ antiporter NhaA [Alphaproteobacteria bacterium]